MTTHKILQFDIQFSLDNAQSKEIEKQLNEFSKKGWEVIINQSFLVICKWEFLNWFIY